MLEDLIKQIEDETDRAQVAGLATKYSFLKEHVEAGEIAGPVMERLRAMPGVDPSKELAEVSDWVKWRQNDWNSNKPVFNAAAKAAHLELTARIAELEGKGETEMNLDEVKAALVADGYMKKDDLKGVITQQDLQSALFAQGKAQQKMFASLTPMSVKHFNEFKEEIPYDKIFAYMEENQRFDTATKTLVYPDPKDAYAAIVAPRVSELKAAEIKAQIEAAKAEGIKEGRLAASQAVTGQGMPVDSTGGKGTPFMQRIHERRAEMAASGGSGRLGSGAAAAEGLAAYQRKQMGAAGSM